MNRILEKTMSFLIAFLVILVFVSMFFAMKGANDGLVDNYLLDLSSKLFLIIIILSLVFSIYVLFSAKSKTSSILVAIISSILFFTLSKEVVRLILIYLYDYDIIGKSKGIFAYFSTYNYFFLSLIIFYFLHVFNLISLFRNKKKLISQNNDEDYGEIKIVDSKKRR
ncbi:MAG: hypothetical protein Q4B52_00070 [Tissierellia bacterium]|nr:hypothetical protein [Tissierellia bacterium]